MEKTNVSISAREGEEVTLPCRLQGPLQAGTQPSATWFQAQSSGRASALLTLHHDGSVEYPQEPLARRLYLRRPSAGDFSLTLSSVERGDAGGYYCQLQEWQQQGEGKDWALKALAQSGYTQLATIPPGNACWAAHPAWLLSPAPSLGPEHEMFGGKTFLVGVFWQVLSQ